MMTRKRSLTLLAVVGLMTLTARAYGLDVYLNGVRITGVRDQVFENATVRLDAQGNVRIDAPHYRVEPLEGGDNDAGGPSATSEVHASPPATTVGSRSSSPAADAPPPGGGQGLSQRYWLVAQVNGLGMVQYRIEVRINGRLVRTVTDQENLPPIEVTEYLHPGANTVQIHAVKDLSQGRRSDSSRHWMRVVVSDGHIEGTAVVIDSPGIIFTRNAAQTDSVTRDFTLNAR